MSSTVMVVRRDSRRSITLSKKASSDCSIIVGNTKKIYSDGSTKRRSITLLKEVISLQGNFLAFGSKIPIPIYLINIKDLVRSGQVNLTTKGKRSIYEEQTLLGTMGFKNVASEA
jgi:hypothetical protein